MSWWSKHGANTNPTKYWQNGSKPHIVSGEEDRSRYDGAMGCGLVWEETRDQMDTCSVFITYARFFKPLIAFKVKNKKAVIVKTKNLDWINFQIHSKKIAVL